MGSNSKTPTDMFCFSGVLVNGRQSFRRQKSRNRHEGQRRRKTNRAKSQGRYASMNRRPGSQCLWLLVSDRSPWRSSSLIGNYKSHYRNLIFLGTEKSGFRHFHLSVKCRSSLHTAFAYYSPIGGERSSTTRKADEGKDLLPLLAISSPMNMIINTGNACALNASPPANLLYET